MKGIMSLGAVADPMMQTAGYNKVTHAHQSYRGGMSTAIITE